ncbi:DDE-type integrase/transposase/recombinase [Pseudomonas atacamensis]|uniref:DDE-type integrase/transposase/recombinase n=1 Tax=Pseudomonas atacamensis TaxID=2565368 RepID=UPI001C3DE54D|nr:DDE-type integrase/transposase/recombinase [Pseudomonas atacamensis]QXH74794.1 DDE-type integrase/transposase/recombinase [Pseudomonas atacamensis]
MRDEPPLPCVGSQYIVNGRTMEVIHVDDELVTFRDLERTHSLSLTIDRITAEIARQTIVLFAKPPGDGSKALAFLNPSDRHVISAKRKHYYVDAALKQLGGTLPKKKSQELIARLSFEIKDSSPPSYSTLYKWSKQYKSHHCDQFCLLKDKSNLSRGKRLEPEVEALIHEMIVEHYLSSPGVGVTTLHNFIHAQIIAINRLRENYSTRLLTPPSLSTVKRKIDTLCQLTTDKSRNNQYYIQKKHHTSESNKEQIEALDLAEIDNHNLKIKIVDSNGKTLDSILWWTVIIDVKTRCVIGWELSSTYPCAEKTIRALKKALIAVPGEENIRGKPIHLHSDNGTEFNNSTIKYVLDRLNILYVRGPPYTPNARPYVERFFGTFELWLHEQPGATSRDISGPALYDVDKEAVFTEENIIQYAEYWLENVYHQKKHRTLNMPPSVAWERAMKNRLPPEKFTEEDLDILYRFIRFARISSAGRVHFLSLSWYGPGLPEMRAKLKKGQQAICYCNPLNLGEIWVAHPEDPRSPQRAYATHPEYQNNLTLSEHELLHSQLLDEGREFDDSKAHIALFNLRLRMNKDRRKAQQLRTQVLKETETLPLINNDEKDDEDQNNKVIPLDPDDVDIPEFGGDKI